MEDCRALDTSPQLYTALVAHFAPVTVVTAHASSWHPCPCAVLLRASFTSAHQKLAVSAFRWDLAASAEPSSTSQSHSFRPGHLAVCWLQFGEGWTCAVPHTGGYLGYLGYARHLLYLRIQHPAPLDPGQ